MPVNSPHSQFLCPDQKHRAHFKIFSTGLHTALCTGPWTSVSTFQMSERPASKDSEASLFKTLKAIFTSGLKKSPASSSASTPQLDNPRASFPETRIPSRLANIKIETLLSISSISPLSDQLLPPPSYIDIGISNLSSLDWDIMFKLLDNPNKSTCKFSHLNSTGKTQKANTWPQQLEKYQFLAYSKIQEKLYCRFCFCLAEMEKNRNILAQIVSSIIFTARLGLPLRGHRDDGGTYGSNKLVAN